MAIDYMVTITDKNLKQIAENYLIYHGIDSSDLRRINMTKKGVIETIVTDPQFKESLLKTLKTNLSFSILYDYLNFEDAINNIDFIEDILDKLEAEIQEANKKSRINDARDLLIANGYKLTAPES